VNAPSPSSSASRPLRLAILLLLVAGLLAYADSFWGVFLFDDNDGIVRNPTLLHLWPLSSVIVPPSNSGTTVNGRPFVNLTLAVNYALSGLHPWSYHLVNLLIHLLAALTLLGVIRRTLAGPGFRATPFGGQALPLSLAATLLWTLHPLQTEAVTYVIQRAESLVSLCYLLTLYTFIRGVEEETGGADEIGAAHRSGARRWPWLPLSIAACFLGMATKEVMATAPLLVFLYDRTFIAGTFREAWRRRFPYYLAMASSWLLVGWLTLGTHDRGHTAGFGIGVPWWAYALRQFQSITTYLRLTLWPYPLTFDSGYCIGPAITADLWKVIPAALLILLLLALTIWALLRRPRLGFLGAWFFLLLAPSSSIVPVSDIRMEHRVYLALAAVAVGAICGLYAWLGRRSWIVVVGLAVVYGLLTLERNSDYWSAIAFWKSTLIHQPENPKAHIELGNAYFADGQTLAAEDQFRQALLLPSERSLAYNGLGGVLSRFGQQDQAIAAFQAALRLQPDYADAHYNLGNTFILLGRWPEAIAELKASLQSRPEYFQAHDSLGIALAETGQMAAAADQFRQALQLNPAAANAHYNLGKALAALGQKAEAAAEFQAALRLQPDNPQIQEALDKLTGP